MKAWIDAGSPLAPVSFGDYRSWATIIGGILQVVGIPGFLANSAERFDDAAAEQEEVTQVVAMWWDVFAERPVMARELFEQAQLWNIVPDLASPKGERSMTTVFGTWLRSHRDQVILGWRITDAGLDRTKARLWKLVPAGRGDLDERHFAKVLVNGDAAGTAGTSPFPAFSERPSDVPVVDTDVELLAEPPTVPAASALTRRERPRPPVRGPRVLRRLANRSRSSAHGRMRRVPSPIHRRYDRVGVRQGRARFEARPGYCMDCAVSRDPSSLVVVVAKEPAFP